MILLTVLSFNGAPVADMAGLAASFDELGGTIGRADNNQLVLPDPERSISRVHARIVFRAGAYAVIDSGSNPIAVNGRTLGSSSEQVLKPGDQLQIGGYLLAVSAGAGAGSATPSSSDPFADLFGDIGSGLAAPQPATYAPAPAVQSSPTAWPAPAPTPSAAAGQIPDDWDPFASHGAAAPASGSVFAPAPAPASSPANSSGLSDLQFGASKADSLDAMFGLGPGGPSGDPFGALPGAALPANMAAHADPLQSLARPAAVGNASLANHGSELNAAMPKVRVQEPGPAAAAATPAIPLGAVFSWDEPSEQVPHTSPSFISRPQFEAAPAPVPSPSPPPPPPPPPPLAASATAKPPVAMPAAAAPAAAAGDSALLSALLDGLGSPGLRIDALTPDLMRLLGSLLREATRGSVELLVARAALKREMRAEMTMIVARENNPLKFSPSAEVALQYLLSPPLPGFMAAEPAMRDAFDDLRAHQLAVMAGMRSALEGVLQRFNPQQLEGELTQRSAISALLPALRKARLWDLFQDLFAQLSNEAQDQFEDLFGQAFLDAYEDQLDRLAAEPRSS
ncbi:type VI secretion system-associated FHA domain protein TagH [Paucibacter sp. B2R-40]|uniref:type VI secretion system-associated FHA domain protein TagH n=1 Tax=Paucibacter sp. B2R-40 TaxID=2893554 RepID=UPI0021E39299|nr:type VI secretion system-associated FHA domain protein TagH [Paucibacter sp. B2R-40]MCV2355947.1 type VI secretion system-associated FHA domain protein TagH [Paucibacter sp. B2R-40]